MRIVLSKATGRAKCRHNNCENKPEYIEKGRIKKGTTCVIVYQSGASGLFAAHYCRNCIDKIYEDMKKVLNPALWIFH